VRVAAMAPAWKMGTFAWSGVGCGVTDGVGDDWLAWLGVRPDKMDGPLDDEDGEGPARQALSTTVVVHRPTSLRLWADW